MRPVLREKDLLAEIDRLKKIINELKTSKPYGLVWEDKPEQFETDTENAVPVLKTKGGKFQNVELDPNADHNVLIEGDNYHALSVLSYTHKGKVDVIYIDPPYNTGEKDFKYNDHFVDREDPFRHTKWLSFMEKRLTLARTLLKTTGILFISIDDHEQAALRMLCDKMFREDNFHGCLTWIKRTKSTNSGKARRMLQQKAEYVLVYGSTSAQAFQGFQLLYSGRKKEYPHNGKHGKCRFENLEATDYGRKKRDTMKFRILGIGPRPGRRWQIGQETAIKLVAEGKIELVDGIPMRAVYPEDEEDESFIPFWSHLENTGTAETGKQELAEIVGPDHGFDTVKPLPLIKQLLQRFPRDAIVLDFFAGSGTTGHAVLESNKNDGGNRRFILCTNNENNICEDVTYERIKRVMKGYRTPAGEKVEGLGGNLKYLKTDFVKKELPVGLSDEAKLKLTHRANLLLSLKENTFTPVETTDYYEISVSPTKMTAVYFREDKTELTTMLDKLLHLSGNKPVTVYIFAWEKGAYKAGIPGYPFDFQDIPEPIVEVYQSIGY